MIRALFLNCVLLTFAAVNADEPRIECDAERLARARQRIESREEPFATYWSLAKADAEETLPLEATPYLGGDSLQFHHAAQAQGIAARLLAYAWRLEENEAAGARAVELLHAWAIAMPMPGTAFDPNIRFPNSGMDIARGMLPFVAACDLLSGHPALTTGKRKRILLWFRTLAEGVKEGMKRWEENDDFGQQRFQNHHAAHMLGLTLFGAALNDRAMMQLAYDSKANSKDFKDLVRGLILMPGDEPLGGLRGKPLHAGEIDDRVRTSSGSGLTYCHLSLTLLLYAAEVQSRYRGEDCLNWKAPGGETLRLAAEFYSDFFRTKNATLNGGYYTHDQPHIQNNTPYFGSFEVALCHWPDSLSIRKLATATDRSRTPRSWLCYYGLPVLTHGVSELED